MTDYKLLAIGAIVADCEEVQKSGESNYYKETEKQSAYDQIREEVLGTRCKDCDHIKARWEWIGDPAFRQFKGFECDLNECMKLD